MLPDKVKIVVGSPVYYADPNGALCAHLDCFGPLPEEKVLLADGSDVTELVKKPKNG